MYYRVVKGLTGKKGLGRGEIGPQPHDTALRLFVRYSITREGMSSSRILCIVLIVLWMAVGVEGACDRCNPGTYCTSRWFYGRCNSCPAGKYCPGGTYQFAKQITCEAGKYSAARASFCTNCEAGKYSGVKGATTASTCRDCAAGKYSGV